MNSLVLRRARGFTLIELLITVALAVVLLTVALPGMQSFFDRERLISATEQVYSHIQQARIESIARSRGIYVKFEADGNNLIYGISQEAGCDLDVDGDTNPVSTTNNACVLIVDSGDGDASASMDITDVASLNDLVLMRFDLGEYQGNISAASVSKSEIKFDNLRGVPYEKDPVTGDFVKISPEVKVAVTSKLGRELTLSIASLGQMNICSSGTVSVLGYSDCE
jgi:type IV fimbrial biogenesis protein FimT